MRKIFTFLFVALLTTNLWATQTVVPAGTSTPENQVKAAVDAASAGDTIVLETANYVEWQSITVDKKITIMAAEGAEPMIKVAKFKVKAPFEINGVECYSHNSDYMFYTEANIDGVVALKNCTLRDDIHNMYYIVSGYAVNQLVIDNCLIKNFTKDGNAVIYGDGTITSFEMRNSTVMNCTGAYPIRVKNASSIIVNHCTFYNNGERVMLLGDNTAPATCAVSNCVVSNPTEVSNYCIATYAGTVDNCVYYNTSAPRSSSSTNTNCINADPLFVDPENGDFNFAFTSPLFLAATDGSNIGDPRWGVEAGENAVNVPDTLPNAEALLTGEDMKLEEGDILFWDDLNKPGSSYASWVVNAQKVGDYDVYVKEVSGDKGHQYQFSIANQTAWLAKEAEPEYNFSQGDIKIGTFTINEKGYHLFQLNNIGQWSSGRVEYVMLRYRGGAQMAVPCFLPADEAMLYGPKIVQKDEGIAWGDNVNIEEDYAVWNINVTKAGVYVVTMNVSKANGSGHTFSIDVYDSSEEQVGTTIAEPSGEITMAVGTYTVRLNNATQWSSAIMESVSFMRKGGDVVDVPGILPAEDALLGGKVIRLENGSVKWPDKNDVDNHYVTWNINATAAGDVDVIAHIGEPPAGVDASSHNFTATLYQGETAISSIPEPKKTSATGEITFGTLNIPEAGVYALRLTNAVEWSSAIVDALELREAQVIETIEIGDDQTDVDFTAYAGQTVNIKLNRTIKADMFTPFCLPFALHSGALNSVLKSDKAYVLDDAQIQDQTLSVKLQTYSSIYQGTPFLIKPTEEVVDPIFENVTIMDDPQASSTTRGDVTFQGSFAKEDLTEPSKVLLVGNNNTLFYPNDATPYIKSMRAYFRVNVEANMLPRFAAFVEPGNAPTEMIIVGGEAERQKGHRKVLVDGQIRILHEGKCYSILGLER